MARLPPDPKYLLRGEMGSVTCTLFQLSADAEHLCAATDKGDIHLWDLNSNRELCRIGSQQDSCLSLQALNGDELFAQHKSGLINVYKKAESGWIAHKSLSIDFHHYCRFHAFSESEIAVPLRDSSFGLLSAKTLRVELKVKPRDGEKLGEVMAIKPLGDDKLALVAYEIGKLLLWDVRRAAALDSFTLNETCPLALDFHADLQKAAVVGTADSIQVFDVSDNKLREGSKIGMRNAGSSAIAIRPDGKIMTVGGWDGRVRIFSCKRSTPLAVLDQHRGSVQHVNYSPRPVAAYNHKRVMATAATDGYVALWDIYN